MSWGLLGPAPGPAAHSHFEHRGVTLTAIPWPLFTVSWNSHSCPVTVTVLQTSPGLGPVSPVLTGILLSQF
jgi:hypothetical protein